MLFCTRNQTCISCRKCQVFFTGFTGSPRSVCVLGFLCLKIKPIYKYMAAKCEFISWISKTAFKIKIISTWVMYVIYLVIRTAFSKFWTKSNSLPKAEYWSLNRIVCLFDIICSSKIIIWPFKRAMDLFIRQFTWYGALEELGCTNWRPNKHFDSEIDICLENHNGQKTWKNCYEQTNFLPITCCGKDVKISPTIQKRS